MSHPEPGGPRPGWAGSVLLALLHGYQRWISPALGPRCRFYPSCSAYAVRAIELHGAARGSWLALRRLVKCQPFHPGGIDHVPPANGRAGSRRRGRGEVTSASPAERGSL